MKKIFLSLGLLSLVAAGCNLTTSNTSTPQAQTANGNINSTVPIQPNIVYSSPTANGDTHTINKPDTIYENINANFSINIPLGFAYQDSPAVGGAGEDILEIWNPNYPNDYDTVAISVYSEPDMTNGKTYAYPSQFLKDKSFLPANSKIVSTIYSTQAGYPEAIQTISTPNGEGKIRAILKDKLIYVILEAPSTDNDFENIAESLKFIK